MNNSYSEKAIAPHIDNSGSNGMAHNSDKGAGLLDEPASPPTSFNDGRTTGASPCQIEIAQFPTQDLLKGLPALPEGGACKPVCEVMILQGANNYFRSKGEPPRYPEVDNIIIPERVRKMVDSKRAPQWEYQMRVAERVNAGELVHGDLVFNKNAVSMIDTRTVPGCVYQCLFDRDEVLDFLRFQNIKLPRYGKPTRLTEDQKFLFKMRFEGVPL